MTPFAGCLSARHVLPHARGSPPVSKGTQGVRWRLRAAAALVRREAPHRRPHSRKASRLRRRRCASGPVENNRPPRDPPQARDADELSSSRPPVLVLMLVLILRLEGHRYAGGLRCRAGRRMPAVLVVPLMVSFPGREGRIESCPDGDLEEAGREIRRRLFFRRGRTAD